jgi:glycosyltransferase involved in cell wall biosynthesis
MPKVNLFSYRFRDEGAAIAAYDLYKELKRLMFNIDSVVFSPKDRHLADTNACHPFFAFLYIYLDLALSYIATKRSHGYYTFLNASLPLFMLSKDALQCDIIHVHWHHRGFLGPRQLLKLAQKHILLLTIHDHWLFTGGCHFPTQCKQHTKHCAKCPSIKKYIPSPASRSLAYKEKIAAHPKIYFVFPSQYSLRFATEVFPCIKSKSFVIPNLVSLPEPDSRSLSQSYKSINQQQPIVGLQLTNNPRKGDLEALRVLASISTHINIKVYFFGEELIGDSCHISQLNHCHAGYIRDRHELVQYYNSIDVFVSAAKDETFGLTIAEAQACGAPVVAFNSSAVSEIIIHKTTGYLAEPGNLQDLEAGILYCLDCLSKLSFEAARFARNRFNPQKIAEQYIDLYAKLS